MRSDGSSTGTRGASLAAGLAHARAPPAVRTWTTGCSPSQLASGMAIPSQVRSSQGEDPPSSSRRARPSGLTVQNRPSSSKSRPGGRPKTTRAPDAGDQVMRYMARSSPGRGMRSCPLSSATRPRRRRRIGSPTRTGRPGLGWMSSASSINAACRPSGESLRSNHSPRAMSRGAPLGTSRTTKVEGSARVLDWRACPLGM
ncbi:hypothetical protein D3C72_982250 [compost metagenome]